MALLPPSPNTSKRIQKDLYQDPQLTAQDLNHLKEWLSKQPHLPQIDDDVFLERFLYGCKYRLSKCKEVLDMHYTVRGALPEFYKDRDPKNADMESICKAVCFITLPKLTPQGHRVIFARFLDQDSEKFHFPNSVKYAFMLFDVRLQRESWCGEVLLYDMKEVNMGHLAKISPVIMKKFLLCLQNAYPLRIKGVHFINAPVFMDKLLALIKPFLKKKLQDRICVHTSIDTLYKAVPKDILPEEYGGMTGSLKELNDSWKENVDSYRSWLIGSENIKADESKRPRKVDYGELFGMEGSFKTLAID